MLEAARSAAVDGDLVAEQIDELHGKGVLARQERARLYLGRRVWLLQEGFEVPEEPPHAGPVVWVARSDDADRGTMQETIGCLLLADMPRAEAQQAIADLRALGVKRAILLTGDRRNVAEEIGAKLQLDQVMEEVLPEQKLKIVDAECQNHTVMMVGDGINDALALARGDVGVAIGAVGSDVALQSADVALMSDDLRRLAATVKLARSTRRIIHQNVFVGAGLSILFVYLASIGLFGPIVGGLLHYLGPLFVVGNSARLLAIEEAVK